MTKYYLSYTQLGALEKEMMRIPGFAQQFSGHRRFRYTPEMCDCELCIRANEKEMCQVDGTCICIDERMEAGCLFGVPLPDALHGKLMKRATGIANKQLPCPLDDPYIKARMHTLKKQGARFLLPSNAAYTAAAFLLAANMEVWSKASRSFTAEAIHFPSVKTAQLSPTNQLLLLAAESLYTSAHLPFEAIPYTTSTPDELLALFFTGEYIAAFGLPTTYWKQTEVPNV